MDEQKKGCRSDRMLSFGVGSASVSTSAPSEGGGITQEAEREQFRDWLNEAVNTALDKSTDKKAFTSLVNTALLIGLPLPPPLVTVNEDDDMYFHWKVNDKVLDLIIRTPGTYEWYYEDDSEGTDEPDYRGGTSNTHHVSAELTYAVEEMVEG